MPRKQHKYHFIYKTTNKINEKYYIGMHSTDIIEDGYIGSGTILWHAIKKYGIENFKRETLEFFPDRCSLRDREKEIVNEFLLKDPLCMNICRGGGSDRYGTTTPNRKSRPLSDEHKKHISENCLGKSGKYIRTEEIKNKLSLAFKGIKISEETKKQISQSCIGKKWIHNDQTKETRQIKKGVEIPSGWKLGRN